MFKKLCFSIALTALSVVSITQCSDRIPSIKELIGHIAQEKRSIVLDLNKTMIISEKAIEHMKETVKDTYEPLTSKIMAVVNNIIKSEEFSASLNKVTDYQVNCIVDRTMNFDDITYNPQDYSTTQKAETELINAFPSLDQQTEQLFNIFYVTIANYRNCILLLKKLNLKENELQQKLEALPASDNTITE